MTIRVGDQAYGLEAPSSEALSYFERAYSACRGHPSEEIGRFVLDACGRNWRLCCDGAVLAAGSLHRVSALLDWEMTRRAVKQDTTCAAFHAAWTVCGRRAVLLAGEGGSGKSRLCLQLLARGFRCGAEDVAFITDDRLVPFPRAIHLRRDDPVLRLVDDASRIFPSCDGRSCVALGADDAAMHADIGDLLVAFLDPCKRAADRSRPLAPLKGLERLFRLCHRLDRVTQPMFRTLSAIACAGRMHVLPRQDADSALLDLLETASD